MIRLAIGLQTTENISLADAVLLLVVPIVNTNSVLLEVGRGWCRILRRCGGVADGWLQSHEIFACLPTVVEELTSVGVMACRILGRVVLVLNTLRVMLIHWYEALGNAVGGPMDWN